MAKVSKLKRVFSFNGKELQDTDPAKSPQWLITNVFSKMYPSLANGSYKGPIIREASSGQQAEFYELKGNLGTKG